MTSYTSTTPSVAYAVPQYTSAYDVTRIHDWLIWSIINMFVGWGTGLLPLIFSLICRTKKQDNDVHGARTMSTLALVFNILSTIGGIIGWIVLILVLVLVVNVTHHYIPTT